MKTTVVPQPQTLVEALQSAPRRGTERGVVFLDRREREHHLSWTEIDARAERAAGALATAGIGPGDRVGIVLPTGPAFLDALFGCQRLGAVPVPLYPPMRLGKLEEYYAKTAAMLDATDAVALIADARTRRFLGQVRAQVKRPLTLIAAESLTKGTPQETAPPGPDDLAVVQFSSGTTVAPKPVALSHRAVLANARAILDYSEAACDDELVGVCWLPLYHDMGLIGCLLSAMLAGIRLVLIPPEDFLVRPAIWLRAISRYRGAVSPAPNFAYSLCLDRVRDDDLEGVDLSCWRVAMNGAEPVSAATVRAFTQRFGHWGLREDAVKPVYGLSEAALAITFPALGSAGMRTLSVNRDAVAAGRIVPGDCLELVSVGPPLPGYQVEVRDDDGAVLPEREVGRIWVSGPSLMRGYLNGIQSPIHKGWLDTGDRGAIDASELFITGREKDVVILRGQNHLPFDIESALDDVQGIRKGCVAAVGDVDETGERLVIFFETREPTEEMVDQCRRAVRARTGLDPAELVPLDPGTLPRTSSGKIRRRAALERWRGGTLTAPRKVTRTLLAAELAKNLVSGVRARWST